MKLMEFYRRTPTYYKTRRAVCLRGAIGRGKSTVMGLVPALLGSKFGGEFGLVILNGPMLNPNDAIGYLIPHRVEAEVNGEKVSRMESEFTQPFWFRTAEGRHLSEFTGGIILVDEEDKMDADVKKIIGEAALSGRLGPHVVPKGWVFWFAGNRQEDRSGSTKDYAHLQNRRRDINIDEDIDGLIEVYNRMKLNPVFVAFAANNSHVLHENIPDTIKPWCTPRSFEAAARHVMACMEDAGLDPMGEEMPSDPFIQEEIAGDIGTGAAAQLFATIELQKHMPRFSDIVANPKKAKVPDAADAQMLVCFNLAARVDEKSIEPVMEYLKGFPEEFTITFGKAAVARDFNLVNTKAFGKWTKENASLMMAISDMR